MRSYRNSEVRASAFRSPRRGCVPLVEIRSHVFDVERDLPRERGEIGVFLLVAKLTEEIDADVAAVQFTIEMEQMHLQYRPPLLLDRWPHA